MAVGCGTVECEQLLNSLLDAFVFTSPHSNKSCAVTRNIARYGGLPFHLPYGVVCYPESDWTIIPFFPTTSHTRDAATFLQFPSFDFALALPFSLVVHKVRIM
ncbi:unnamed protein product [Ectocarpus sp. 8 AP-2014]